MSKFHLRVGALTITLATGSDEAIDDAFLPAARSSDEGADRGLGRRPRVRLHCRDAGRDDHAS